MHINAHKLFKIITLHALHRLHDRNLKTESCIFLPFLHTSKVNRFLRNARNFGFCINLDEDEGISLSLIIIIQTPKTMF